MKETIANRLSILCKEKNLTVTALAKLSSVSYSTLRNIVKGDTCCPGIVTLKKVCDGLGISLKDFFKTKDFDALKKK